ncbi:adenosylmethionine--8-amino-7-oxononanoate transaminase [Pseudonocardia benzenivorans]|uniref:Adenosylmethionine-8-amino-7-oxononanoate aminotransferase n=2 Tax=Pseudonocardia TaxID=1847 RepID=F4CMT6_PSEUX|nr:adenosylmethionine--8-amino-7-oxononanoate transaminase [Pseudonocardia dioxanivorans]AEA25035.1 adenosylmethionine-8-amino-7-oxononanoate aminotransferase [Pseudonocardia dioxanivorans CB1190]
MTSHDVGTGPVAPSALDLSTVDRDLVWHPYAPMPATVAPLVVESATGVRLRLATAGGPVEVVDGMSSWWAAIHGYRHPALDAAVTAQLGTMSHVMFGGLTHAPAVALARTLVEIAPGELAHVFFSDSGSVSVEVAIKMCLQYQRSRGRPAKHRLMTWRGGYHGDTFGAMSVCDPDGGMHSLWRDVLPQQVFAPAPPVAFETGYVAELARLVETHADELAAVVVEPVVQGAGGMRFHDPRYLHVLRELCLANDVLLVFDEIATGFGRTGELFAAEHAGVAPDVMCVGKALTGGYLSLAATLCTPEVARGISDGEAGVLMHGPTFMGNPLACSVAKASVDLLRQGDWRGRVRAVADGLRAGLAPARSLPGVRDVRVLGAIGVVQLDHEVDVAAATAAAVGAGVWLRPFRDLVYTMPPYVCTPAEIATIAAGVCAAAAAG